jgi:hypothetical protein
MECKCGGTLVELVNKGEMKDGRTTTTVRCVGCGGYARQDTHEIDRCPIDVSKLAGKWVEWKQKRGTLGWTKVANGDV